MHSSSGNVPIYMLIGIFRMTRYTISGGSIMTPWQRGARRAASVLLRQKTPIQGDEHALLHMPDNARHKPKEMETRETRVCVAKLLQMLKKKPPAGIFIAIKVFTCLYNPSKIVRLHMSLRS